MATTITVTVDSVDYVFANDGQEKDLIRYLDPGHTLALPRTLVTRRVLPKKQKGYPGVARNYIKCSWMQSYADETTAPLIMETSVSRRADTSLTELAAMRKRHAALLIDSELDSFFTALSLG